MQCSGGYDWDGREEGCVRGEHKRQSPGCQLVIPKPQFPHLYQNCNNVHKILSTVDSSICYCYINKKHSKKHHPY